MDIVFTEYTDELACAIDQICSLLYQQTFEKVAKQQPTDWLPEEQRLLTEYPDTITFYGGARRSEVVERIRRVHLQWFNKWLIEQNTGHPPYVQWNSIMDRLLLHATNLLFRIDCDDFVTSDETRIEFKQIADTIKRILSAVVQANPVTIDPAAIPLVQNLLLILFYFTLDTDMAVYLKHLHLVNIINELIRISNDDNEILLQAYRILAVIMAEHDLKQLHNSQRIAQVFITFIRDTIDAGISYEARFHNSLRSLKALTQHDQIREELIEQQGHILFLRCVVEKHFNPHKAKLPALEILLALAFNDNFTTILRDNTAFMDHIRTLTSSEHQDLQRIATALVWKLERTQYQLSPTTSLLSTAEQKRYDVMISYSHSDKDLCHRLLQSLENDQLRVWIDFRSIHGATFNAMAKAIENAEFVFVCMSDAYKQSAFCEMEASYAVKRRCRIIPLVMTPNYKADGWLGVLTSALIYVDIPKLGFERAYQELKKQLELGRNNSVNAVITKETPFHEARTSEVERRVDDISFEFDREYPDCIDIWTEEQVKSFLLEKQLDALVPAIEGMDGQLIHQTYSMCRTNQVEMFSILREDVATTGRGILSLKDYLIFMRVIKPYIPYKTDRRLKLVLPSCTIL